MVKIRRPTFSASLYLTTASAGPVPVSMPFTIKKGTSKTPYTVTAFPNQFIFATNVKNKHINAVLIKVTEVYSLSMKIKPAISKAAERTRQKVFSVPGFQPRL